MADPGPVEQRVEGPDLDLLTGIRSGKPSFYVEYLASAERLRRVIHALDRISRALVRTTEGPGTLVRSVAEAAAEHLMAHWVVFALADGGEQIDDPQPASLSVRCARDKLAALELSVLMTMRLSRPPTGPRLDAWERICEVLAARGIETDPPTLHALKFSLVPDGELRDAQQAVWPT